MKKYEIKYGLVNGGYGTLVVQANDTYGAHKVFASMVSNYARILSTRVVGRA
jgi:hypothetical protein